MTRARIGARRNRSDGINRGVSHNIRKTNKKSSGKQTKIRPFGQLPPSPKVKPVDRVPIEPTTSQTKSDNKFFRCRDLNRRATVSMSKALKLELTSEGLQRTPAPTRLGPYKNVPAAPARGRVVSPPHFRDDLLTVIDGLNSSVDGSPERPSTPLTPATPGSHRSLRLRMDSSSDEGTPRRSPRKHPATPGSAAATPGGGATLPPGAARGRQTTPQRHLPSTRTGAPLRRSPRKQQYTPVPAAVPTHAENEGPTRLTLTPRRSPRKHATPQARAAAATPTTPTAVYDRLEEQLMRMEDGEDKENEAPGRRKKDEDARYYSIFYKKPASASGSSPKSKAKPAAPKETRKSTRSAAQSDRLEQLVIDAGQRQFGVITCNTCSVVYTLGDPEDEAVHARHHTGYLGALAFPGWKREHEVGQFMDGRVVMVTPRDPGHAWKKVDSVLKIVDAELGFVGVGVRNKAQSKVFFYIVQRQIAGCLVAERVSRAFQMLPAVSDDSEARPSGVHCSTSPQPCRAGVSRVWVHRDHRRQRLATRLVLAMKNNFDVTPLQWADVAFSDPTPDGLQFAANVTGTDQFLVYNQ